MEHAGHKTHAHAAHDHDTATSTKDPVCGMTVDPATAKGGSHAHEGVTYWFCNPRCREKFAADPARYVELSQAQAAHAHAPKAAPAAASATEYTCPMHPEIVQLGPGSCPICGMALEPR